MGGIFSFCKGLYYLGVVVGIILVSSGKTGSAGPLSAHISEILGLFVVGGEHGQAPGSFGLWEDSRRKEIVVVMVSGEFWSGRYDGSDEEGIEGGVAGGEGRLARVSNGRGLHWCAGELRMEDSYIPKSGA